MFAQDSWRSITLRGFLRLRRGFRLSASRGLNGLLAEESRPIDYPHQSLPAQFGQH